MAFQFSSPFQRIVGVGWPTGIDYIEVEVRATIERIFSGNPSVVPPFPAVGTGLLRQAWMASMTITPEAVSADDLYLAYRWKDGSLHAVELRDRVLSLSGTLGGWPSHSYGDWPGDYVLGYAGNRESDFDGTETAYVDSAYPDYDFIDYNAGGLLIQELRWGFNGSVGSLDGWETKYEDYLGTGTVRTIALSGLTASIDGVAFTPVAAKASSSFNSINGVVLFKRNEE